MVFDLAHRHQASANCFSIQQNGAGAAISGITTHFSSRESELLPQNARKPLDGGSDHRKLALIHDQLKQTFCSRCGSDGRHHVLTEYASRAHRTNSRVSSRWYAAAARTSLTDDRSLR